MPHPVILVRDHGLVGACLRVGAPAPVRLHARLRAKQHRQSRQKVQSAMLRTGVQSGIGTSSALSKRLSLPSGKPLQILRLPPALQPQPIDTPPAPLPAPVAHQLQWLSSAHLPPRLASQSRRSSPHRYYCPTLATRHCPKYRHSAPGSARTDPGPVRPWFQRPVE